MGPGSVGFVHSNDEHGIKNVGTTAATYFVVAIGPGPEPEKLRQFSTDCRHDKTACRNPDRVGEPGRRARFEKARRQRETTVAAVHVLAVCNGRFNRGFWILRDAGLDTGSIPPCGSGPAISKRPPLGRKFAIEKGQNCFFHARIVGRAIWLDQSLPVTL